MKRDLPSTESDETITCVSCMTPNRVTDARCRKCGYPIGSTVNLDPMQTIQTEGLLLRKALEGRPKLIVLLGVWILFLPVLLVGAGGALYFVLNPRALSDLIFFGALLGLSYIAFIILYRITKNYLTISKSQSPDA